MLPGDDPAMPTLVRFEGLQTRDLLLERAAGKAEIFVKKCSLRPNV